MTYNPSKISQYRTQIMGVAILYVLFFHIPLSCFPVKGNILKVVDYIHNYGYMGVDIFFFVSGFGIYFAYQKKESILSFYKKRLRRIIPFTLPLAILYALIGLYLDEISMPVFFTRASMTAYLFGHEITGWYIPAALIFYLITPLLLKFNKVGTTLIIAIVVITATYFSPNPNTTRPYLDLMIQRLPIYYVGLIVGEMYATKKTINYKWIILSAILALFFMYIKHTSENKRAFFFIITSLWTLPLCCILTSIFSLLKNYDFPFLSFFGKYSLCLYFFQEPIILILLKYIPADPAFLLITISSTIALAFMWQNLIDKLILQFSKKVIS